MDNLLEQVLEFSRKYFSQPESFEAGTWSGEPANDSRSVFAGSASGPAGACGSAMAVGSAANRLGCGLAHSESTVGRPNENNQRNQQMTNSGD